MNFQIYASITINKHIRQNSQFNGLEIHLEIKLDLKKTA